MIRAFIALTPPVTLQQSFADVQAAPEVLARLSVGETSPGALDTEVSR